MCEVGCDLQTAVAADTRLRSQCGVRHHIVGPAKPLQKGRKPLCGGHVPARSEGEIGQSDKGRANHQRARRQRRTILVSTGAVSTVSYPMQEQPTAAEEVATELGAHSAAQPARDALGCTSAAPVKPLSGELRLRGDP